MSDKCRPWATAGQNYSEHYVYVFMSGCHIYACHISAAPGKSVSIYTTYVCITNVSKNQINQHHTVGTWRSNSIWHALMLRQKDGTDRWRDMRPMFYYLPLDAVSMIKNTELRELLWLEAESGDYRKVDFHNLAVDIVQQWRKKKKDRGDHHGGKGILVKI